MKQSTRAAAHFVGDAFHAIAKCPSCEVLREWNDSLRSENEQLIAIISEREDVTENKPLGKPIAPTSWRDLRARLERKQRQIAKELKDRES